MGRLPVIPAETTIQFVKSVLAGCRSDRAVFDVLAEGRTRARHPTPASGRFLLEETPHGPSRVHAEIRSADPDATRQFFADLLGRTVASEGAFPGYTFIDTGAAGGTYVAISPRQSTEDEVLFFVTVEGMVATLAKAERLEGAIVQPVQHVNDTSCGVFADAQGHRIGVAATG
jgi:predicted enzyme related to lactoylglutathione lyase